MIDRIGMVMSAVALVGSAAPDDVVLQPSSKWMVDYAPERCVITRGFGTEPDTAILAITPAPLGDMVELSLITPDDGANAYFTDDAPVTLGGAVKTVSFTIQVAAEKKLRIAHGFISQDDLARIHTAATMTLRARRRSITLPTANIAGAIRAAETCLAKLRDLWGVDPAAYARIATPAEAIRPASWITRNDYPAAAKHARLEGEGLMVWTVGIDGRVHDCRVVKSAGSKALDDAGCAAITDRGRYVPAKDTAGQPTVSWWSRRIRWQLPY